MGGVAVAADVEDIVGAVDDGVDRERWGMERMVRWWQVRRAVRYRRQKEITSHVTYHVFLVTSLCFAVLIPHHRTLSGLICINDMYSIRPRRRLRRRRAEHTDFTSTAATT